MVESNDVSARATAREAAAVAAWSRFVESGVADGAVRPEIAASWARSLAAGVDPRSPLVRPRRIADDDLARRLAEHAALLEIARVHLDWLSAAYASALHAAWFVDRDGIVLYATGTAAARMAHVGLLPGYDWSESGVGTNGAGTALAAGGAVTVEGAEHFARSLHGFSCIGATVRAPSGDVLGAINLSFSGCTLVADRTTGVAHAAYAIEQGLAYRESLRRTSGRLATEQRLAEEASRRVATLEALRESEARFAGAFEHSAIAAAITAPDGRWIRVNRALCAMLGYAESDLVGRSFQSITPNDGLAENMTLLDRVVAGEIDEYRLEKRLVRADGGEVRVLLNAAAVRGADGAPLYLVAQFQDVSEARRAQAEFRASEERYRRVVESAHEGICTVDCTGVITFANARLAHMLGRTVAELEGRSIFELMPADRGFDARLRFARRQRGIAEVADTQFLHADGRSLWTLETASSLFGADGEFTGALYLVNDVTDRRLAQDRMEASERRFRALTEQSSEITCIIGGDGRIQYANPAFSRVFGDSADLGRGRPLLDFVHPDDAAAVAHRLTTAAGAPAAVVTFECAARRRDGAWCTLGAVAQNLSHEPGVGGIVVNAHDVTERRRAEDALRESEARYDRIARHLPGMVYQFIYRTDGTKGFTFASEGARSILGVAPEAVIADPAALFDLVHPDDRAEMHATGAVAVAALAPWNWEGRVRLPTGEERWVQVKSLNERQPDGSILCDGLLIDVTDRRRAALRLEESEQRYRSLFEHNPDAVISFDEDGRFERVNAAAERLSGYPRHELIGRHFDGLILPDAADDTAARFRTAVGGDATSYCSAIRDASGRRVDLSVTNIPIVVGGEVVGVFGVVKDLTRERELEGQLRQAQKMEAIGRLAGGVAHDFNNLLTVILAYTQLAIADLPEHAAARADLREVGSAAQRAASLTGQLLAFSRRQLLQPRRIDANRVVSGVAEMLRRVIGEDVTLSSELAYTLWSVHADPGQLEQVLMNLAVNARDAMPNGGTLRLATTNLTADEAFAQEHPSVAPGDYVALVVEDDGTGIEPAVLPKIFEPFYTTKGVGEGTGLGLATVYGIVAQSGGHIYVTSTPGLGSRFTVLLPRAAATDDESSASVGRPATPGGSETVLLVEDDASVQSAVRRMLRGLGYAVRTASSAADALEIAIAAHGRGERIDLVLTDLVMPNDSGRALGEQLAARWPSLPVLYMSGYTDDEIFRRGLGEAGAAFLEKPFSQQRLAEAVRRMLDGGRGAAA